VREFYCVISSVYPPVPACRNIYSYDDDPKEALREARTIKRGARFAMRFTETNWKLIEKRRID
jgi:hypothetical protein